MFEPAAWKNLTIRSAPPMSSAAVAATTTPVRPRLARCGLAEWEPSAQPMAERATPATAAINPSVRSAPTIFLASDTPGSPSSFGVIFGSANQDNRERILLDMPQHLRDEADPPPQSKTAR